MTAIIKSLKAYPTLVGPVPIAQSTCTSRTLKSSPELVNPSTVNFLSALPQRYDLGLYAGDYFSMNMTLMNKDGTIPNLTGYSSSAQIRDAPGGSLLASFGIVFTNNVITLALQTEDTQNLSGDYVWDCELINPSGLIRTVVGGEVTVTVDVTR